MEQILYPLPDGWKWTNLTDVCTPSRKTVEPNSEEKYNYISLENIESNTGRVISNVPTQGSEISSTKVGFKKGMVLYGKLRPYLNKVVVAKTDGIATTEIIPFECSDAVSPDFLAYFLRSQYFVDLAMNNCSGARMPRATTKLFTQIAKVPITSIIEQKRIVEKLNALLTRIDTAIEHLQESVTLADSMLMSGMEKAFNPLGLPSNETGLYELPKEWTWQNLGRISTIGTGVTPLKGRADYYNNGHINWVTSKATGDDFVSDSEQKITEVALSECRLKLFPVGTLIVALYGQGKTRGQVSELLIESTINQALAAVVVNPDHNSKFVKYFLKRSYLLLRSKATGGTQENLNLSIVKAIQVPLPDIQQQRKIVLSLDALNHQINQVKSEFTSKIELLNQLKASILDSAFKGEL